MDLNVFMQLLKVKALVAQLYPTLCTPMDCSPPGSSVHGILQARILEWVSIPFSRGSSWPRDRIHPTILCCRQILYCWAIKNANRLPEFVLSPADMTLVVLDAPHCFLWTICFRLTWFISCPRPEISLSSKHPWLLLVRYGATDAYCYFTAVLVIVFSSFSGQWN